jgi:hypothetical protein
VQKGDHFSWLSPMNGSLKQNCKVKRLTLRSCRIHDLIYARLRYNVLGFIHFIGLASHRGASLETHGKQNLLFCCGLLLCAPLLCCAFLTDLDVHKSKNILFRTFQQKAFQHQSHCSSISHLVQAANQIKEEAGFTTLTQI